MVNTTGLNPMELQLMMDITRLKEFFICLIRMHNLNEKLNSSCGLSQ